ncbi:MAG: hypothetical protein AAGF60_07765 [Pseudomonadota bacterium]
MSPREVSDRVNAMLDNGETALEADVFMTDALAAARQKGPLGPDWIPVLIANATLITEGLCKYDRGLALMAEARIAGAPDPIMAEIAAAGSGYVWAQIGLTDRAAEAFAPLSAPLADYLGADYAQAARDWIAADAGVEASPGMKHCRTLLAEANTLSQSGDLEQARSLLAAMTFPDVLLEEPAVRLTAAAIGLMHSVVLGLMQDPAASDVHAGALRLLTVSDGAAPQLRPDLSQDAQVRSMLVDVLSGLSTSSSGVPSADVARALLNDIAPDNIYAAAQAEEDAISAAVAQRDWARAAEIVEARLAGPDIDPVDRATSNVTYQSYRALADLDAGRPVDQTALAQAFADVFAQEGVFDAVRIDMGKMITHVFHTAQLGELAFLAGYETWVFLRGSLAANAQSDAAVVGQAQGFARTAGTAIMRGFDLAAQPPGGTPPPGLCQSILEIEVCTIVLAQP